MTQADPSLRFAFTGDLALGGSFLERSRPAGESPLFHLHPLDAELENVDVLVVNLEGPIGSEGVPRSRTATLLHNEPEIIGWLKRFPLAICNLANNHMLDYGPEALFRTKTLLEQNSILAIGAGADHTDANSELIFTVKGLRVAMLSGTSDEPHVGATIATDSSPGCAAIDHPTSLATRVAALAAEADIVIVNLHWGFEYFSFPAPDQVELCRQLAAAGATLVIGHHPHVQQGCEQVGNSLVAYSLGNLILPQTRALNGRIQYRKPATKQFAILHTQLIDRKIVGWRMAGGRADNAWRLIPYQGSDKEAFAQRMAHLAAPLTAADYPRFWNDYQLRRRTELQRESIKEAFVKLFSSDWRTLVRTVSLRDFTRNLRRVLRTLPGIRSFW